MTEIRNRFPQERQQKMIDVIIERQRVGTAELAALMEISLPTVRRDLSVLEQAGLVARTHGGVVARGAGANDMEPLFFEKLRVHQSLKQRIGQKASERLSDGQVGLLDSGTTALALAHALAGRRVTIVTMDLKVAEAASVGQTEVHLVGGRVRNGYFNLIGAWAMEALKTIRADVYFLSADAIDVDGVTTATFEEAQVKRFAISRAQKVAMIADHSKLNQRSFAAICGLDEVDEFITDKGALEKIAPYRNLIPVIETV